MTTATDRRRLCFRCRRNQHRKCLGSWTNCTCLCTLADQAAPDDASSLDGGDVA